MRIFPFLKRILEWNLFLKITLVPLVFHIQKAIYLWGLPTQFKVGVDIEAKQWNQNMMTI